ncbi:MAG: aminopeptidase [Bacteroidota bacterium]
MLDKYAQLLVDYSLEIQPKDKLYLQTTTLAIPLVKEIYRFATRRGAIVEVDLAFEGKGNIFAQEAQYDEQYEYISSLYKEAMQEFNAYLYIRAPFAANTPAERNPEKMLKRNAAVAPYRKTYSERTATRDLKRSLCQFPTQSSADLAQMSLSEYEQFIFNACHLYADDPQAEWLKVRKQQQEVVDFLNKCEHIRYTSEHVDISFSTKGRTWINSDGQTNMPSGEIYTSPVEDSVNGVVHFSLPAIYMGNIVEGVTLWVEDGYIQKWEAKTGKEFLDQIFAIAGTRRFGEAAIGNNYNINRITNNILFDEKIGGTVHMAIGQSYLQAGGKNVSAVHWDMITEMSAGGEIHADGEKIYENGHFLALNS